MWPRLLFSQIWFHVLLLFILKNLIRQNIYKYLQSESVKMNEIYSKNHENV